MFCHFVENYILFEKGGEKMTWTSWIKALPSKTTSGKTNKWLEKKIPQTRPHWFGWDRIVKTTHLRMDCWKLWIKKISLVSLATYLAWPYLSLQVEVVHFGVNECACSAALGVVFWYFVFFFSISSAKITEAKHFRAEPNLNFEQSRLSKHYDVSQQGAVNIISPK